MSIFTFVAVDYTGKQKIVPALSLETPLEKERFEAAIRRKQLRLVLNNKMKPSKSTMLKALFTTS